MLSLYRWSPQPMLLTVVECSTGRLKPLQSEELLFLPCPLNFPFLPQLLVCVCVCVCVLDGLK